MAPRKPKQTDLPPPSHNEAAAEEADRVQLISIISKLDAVDGEIELAMVAVRAARAARKRIVGLGHAAGFSAKELKARLEEVREDSRDQEERIRRETQHRKWLGIIRPDQPSLNLDGQTPEEVRDEAYWRSEGLKAGFRRLSAVPPDACPPRFVQAWLEERANGAAQVPADPGEPETPAPPDFAGENPFEGAEHGFEATEEELQAQGPRQAVQAAREGEVV